MSTWTSRQNEHTKDLFMMGCISEMIDLYVCWTVYRKVGGSSLGVTSSFTSDGKELNILSNVKSVRIEIGTTRQESYLQWRSYPLMTCVPNGMRKFFAWLAKMKLTSKLVWLTSLWTNIPTSTHDSMPTKHSYVLFIVIYSNIMLPMHSQWHKHKPTA